MSIPAWKEYIISLPAEPEKVCRGKCGLSLPLSRYAFNKDESKRWGSCVECRTETVENVKLKATERATKRKIEGDEKECLGIEINRQCERVFRSTGKFNRLCNACARASKDIW